MTAPAQFTGGPIGYGYHWQSGALTSVTDIGEQTFSFAYNARSELTGIGYGGGINQTLGYDGDGRLSSDVITNGSNQSFPYYPGPKLRSFAVTSRNGRGQILNSADSVQSDQVNATYSGLGYLGTSNMRQSLVNGATGGPASYASTDTYTYDGLGNLSTTDVRDSTDVQGGWSITRRLGSNAYSTVGRLTTRTVEYIVPTYCCETTVYSYDPSGNNSFEAMTSGVYVTTERAAYYGPDEKLVASDRRATGRRIFEQYRYDALGRRVWLKSVTKCEPTNAIECVTPYVRRTVWDGAQELAEIQVPVDTLNAQVEEMDTGYPPRPFTFVGSYGDPNPWYGRVVYGPGLAVDQPLTVTRYDYRDKPADEANPLTWPRFTWQVYWNYQGVPAYGTLTTGAWAHPYQLGQNQQGCPNLGNQTTDRCVIVQWPLMHSAYDQNRGKAQYRSWHGSLLEGKRDRSGLEYKRNRLYDPQTGRFTQEDPIGLAGGINLYGFASGDPVNYSDPFGLCPEWIIKLRAPRNFPPAELAFAKSISCPKAFKYFRALSWAEGFANLRTGLPRTHPWNDALRHAYASCVLTREAGIGEDGALLAGDAHESTEDARRHPGDTEMDQMNNTVGRRVGKNTQVRCDQGVIDAWNAGEMDASAEPGFQPSGPQYEAPVSP